MNAQAIVALVGVGITFICAVIGGVWKISASIQQITNRLDTIIAIHLPAVYVRIDKLDSELERHRNIVEQGQREHGNSKFRN